MDLIITCPKCNAKIDVSKQITELLSDTLDQEKAKLKQDNAKLLAEERNRAAAEMKEHLRKAVEDAASKAKQQELARYDAERREFQKQLLAKNKELQLVLARQEEKVSEIVAARVKADLQQATANVEKSYQEKLGKKDLALAEFQDKCNKAEIKLQELQIKLGQGSAQTQGIIAEKQLCEFLRDSMPADRCEVEKHGQGRKGTDVIIHVLRGGQRVGSLIVDDKWAAQWGRGWPEQVWNDMQHHNADFAYIAVNHDALPDQIRAAGFGLAPCRRPGVRVWAIDRSNRELLLAILIDSVDKLLKLAETRDVYGASSKEMELLRTYLTRDYETDIRNKVKHLSAAVKALNDMHAKVELEYERAMDALRGYWMTEARVHHGITSSFAAQSGRVLPQIDFPRQ